MALRKIKPIHSEKIAPKNAKTVGMTPDGRPIMKEQIRRTKSKEKIDPETGMVMHRKNQMTGELLHKIREPVPYVQEREFTLESEGNANVRRQEYRRPSEEDIRRRRRAEAAEQLLPQLAEAMVDADVSPEELVAQLRRAREEADEEAVRDMEEDYPELLDDVPEPAGEGDADHIDPSDFPKMAGPMVWDLSNGDRLTKATKDEAVAAEAALHEAEDDEE